MRAEGRAPAAWTIERRRDPEAVSAILATLPEWFGIEEATANYVERAAVSESFLAILGDEVIGVALVERHYPESAELALLAVKATHRGRGAGRALVEQVAAAAGLDGAVLLQVNTVGPSHDDVNYAETRAFYRSVGFIPLREVDGLEWDGPTLILVRVLAAQES